MEERTMKDATSPRQASNRRDWLHRLDRLWIDGRGSLRRSAAGLIIRICALLLSAMLFIGAAAAQTPYGPIVNRQLQPRQQQLEIKWNLWNNRAQREVDPLYNEILRAASRSIDHVQR
jgi:hypothetical protein